MPIHTRLILNTNLLYQILYFRHICTEAASQTIRFVLLLAFVSIVHYLSNTFLYLDVNVSICCFNFYAPWSSRWNLTWCERKVPPSYTMKRASTLTPPGDGKRASTRPWYIVALCMAGLRKSIAEGKHASFFYFFVFYSIFIAHKFAEKFQCICFKKFLNGWLLYTWYIIIITFK